MDERVPYGGGCNILYSPNEGSQNLLCINPILAIHQGGWDVTLFCGYVNIRGHSSVGFTLFSGYVHIRGHSPRGAGGVLPCSVSMSILGAIHHRDLPCSVGMSMLQASRLSSV